MKSIRRRLTISLLGGLALLWLLAGTGVFIAVRSGLLKAVDAELAIDAQVLRFVVRGDNPAFGESKPELPGGGKGRGPVRRLQERTTTYDEPGSGSFYQGWTGDGTTADRSASLGERHLPYPENTAAKTSFATTQLDDGTPVRTMSFRIAPGGKGRPKGAKRSSENTTMITIARDLGSVNQTLRSLSLGIAVIGLIAAGGAVLLVGGALKDGLKPLRNLGAQTREIDAGSLDARFDSAEAPIELQPIYRRLNDLMERIGNSFERERRFSSDLAHEMRTPVAELKMLSEVALKWPDQADPETQRESLAIACQLESMIENLLALARWESGEAVVNKEAVDLEVATRNCWESFSAKAGEKQLDMQFAFEEGGVVLETDPDMLLHILNNLLSNAVEYTPTGGKISVTGHAATIEISNTVADIDQEEVSQFFDRYWRRDKVRSDSHHSGLGLSLAKACAEALGLDLSANLEGNTIRFTLAET